MSSKSSNCTQSDSLYKGIDNKLNNEKYSFCAFFAKVRQNICALFCPCAPKEQIFENLSEYRILEKRKIDLNLSFKIQYQYHYLENYEPSKNCLKTSLIVTFNWCGMILHKLVWPKRSVLYKHRSTYSMAPSQSQAFKFFSAK